MSGETWLMWGLPASVLGIACVDQELHVIVDRPEQIVDQLGRRRDDRRAASVRSLIIHRVNRRRQLFGGDTVQLKPDGRSGRLSANPCRRFIEEDGIADA